jgi:Histidine kinase-, DNA gyrase B-, and HSP90-like ATPase
MMDISPRPRFLYSVRAERGDVVRLCSEAVDNSFDAGARNVVIAISRQEISFVDDGIGVALKNFPALFTLGDHAQLTSTKLGRFGVGITSQAINVANEMSVRSISADGCFKAKVDWRDVLRDGWKLEDPVRLPFAVGTPTGTVITLTGLRPLVRWTMDKLLDELGQRFYPALAEGRSITVNGVPVPVLADPPMVDVVERTFEFDGGRSATLRAGRHSLWTARGVPLLVEGSRPGLILPEVAQAGDRCNKAFLGARWRVRAWINPLTACSPASRPGGLAARGRPPWSTDRRRGAGCRRCRRRNCRHRGSVRRG